MKKDPYLVIRLKNGESFYKHFHPDPQRQQVMLDHIQDCIQNDELCCFTSYDGVCHGAVYGNFIDACHTGTVEVKENIIKADEEFPGMPRDLEKMRCDVYLRNGTTLHGIIPPTTYPQRSSLLRAATSQKTWYFFGKRRNEEIAGFNFVGLYCGCSNKELNLRGCPSASGGHCPTWLPVEKIDHYER